MSLHNDEIGWWQFLVTENSVTNVLWQISDEHSVTTLSYNCDGQVLFWHPFFCDENVFNHRFLTDISSLLFVTDAFFIIKNSDDKNYDGNVSVTKPYLWQNSDENNSDKHFHHYSIVFL